MNSDRTHPNLKGHKVSVKKLVRSLRHPNVPTPPVGSVQMVQLITFGTHRYAK